jgi:hypothetical protein
MRIFMIGLDRGLNPGKGRNFLFVSVPKLALGFTQLLLCLVPEALFVTIKWPELGVSV